MLYDRGQIRSINLMRITRPDLARVIALRLDAGLAEPEPTLEGALATA